MEQEPGAQASGSLLGSNASQVYDCTPLMETTMRTIIRVAASVAIVACLITAAGAGENPQAPPVQAQAQPKLDPPHQGYAELEQSARKLLAAYSSGDGQKLFDALSASRRNGVALSLARLVAKFDQKPESFEKFKKKLTTMDPAGKLKIKSLDDLRALSPAQYLAYAAGMLRASATEEVSRKLKEPWYMTEREIGVAQTRSLTRETMLFTRGFVQFENLGTDKISVYCMPDDDGWCVASFDFKIGEMHFEFSGRIVGTTGPQFPDAMGSEARASLSALKDRARVMYQRNRRAPATLEDLGIGATELKGSYFTNDCYSITKAEAAEWIAICKPTDSDGPIMAVCANLSNGSAKFFEYEDADAMEASPPTLAENR